MLDSNGMLWVKNYDQIFVLDTRVANQTGNIIIVSTIEITDKYVKTFNYTFTIVEEEPASQLFAPEANGDAI